MKELVSQLLWTDNQPMSLAGLPIGRRVTVARGNAGQLVVFSPMKATPASIADLKQLGPIAAFVVSSRVHDLFYDGYFQAFAEARFIGSRASVADHRAWPLTEITTVLPELEGFAYVVLDGMPRVQEHVFFHERTKTLILADALFNLPVADGGWTRWIMRLADAGGKPRPSRLFRAMIRSRPDFAASLRSAMEWNFERIIPGHGDVIAKDATAIFRQAFEDFL